MFNINTSHKRKKPQNLKVHFPHINNTFPLSIKTTSASKALNAPPFSLHKATNQKYSIVTTPTK